MRTITGKKSKDNNIIKQEIIFYFFVLFSFWDTADGVDVSEQLTSHNKNIMEMKIIQVEPGASNDGH